MININLRLFKKLSFLSKKILNDKTSTVFTYAINSLHVLRAHPDYLEEQKIFFNKIYQNNFFLFTLFKSLLKFLYLILEDLIISIFIKSKTLNEDKKIIFVSHIFNKNVLDKIVHDKFYLYLK